MGPVEGFMMKVVDRFLLVHEVIAREQFNCGATVFLARHILEKYIIDRLLK